MSNATSATRNRNGPYVVQTIDPTTANKRQVTRLIESSSDAWTSEASDVQPPGELPEDPLALAYLIAISLPLPLADKQASAAAFLRRRSRDRQASTCRSLNPRRPCCLRSA